MFEMIPVHPCVGWGLIETLPVSCTGEVGYTKLAFSLVQPRGVKAAKRVTARARSKQTDAVGSGTTLAPQTSREIFCAPTL